MKQKILNAITGGMVLVFFPFSIGAQRAPEMYVKRHTDTQLKPGLFGATSRIMVLGLQGAFYCRLDSGESWEKVARVGPHADVKVRFDSPDNNFVFWRASSYLPYWQTKHGRWYVDEIVPRHGDGNGLRQDKICQYSRVKVIESSPARVLICWRYIPDFDNPGFSGWVEEYYTIYPDGVCMRAVRKATKRLRDWVNPANMTIQKLLLTENGIIPLPDSWQKPAALLLDNSSAGSYHNLGYDKMKRCYIVKCNKNGLPSALNFILDATKGKSIHDPVILIRNWGDADTRITVDGKVFKDYKIGYAKHMNSSDLIVWFSQETTDSITISILPEGGGKPVTRATVPDPYKHRPPVFPEGSSDPGPFGAYYTQLKYSQEWDEPWRVGEYSDVVVQFDESLDRFVFWRGTCNIPCWANDLNHWYTNEFCERRGKDAGLTGCCEPMQDHECRYSYSQIIYSHDARVIIHWRYALCDRYYRHPFVDETGWGDWVDEYYTIYPDEVCVRKATLYTSEPDKFNEWHEAIPLVGAGTIPEENIRMEAVALTDINGNKHLYSWKNGFPKTFEDGLNIMLVRLKGNTMPFVITESRGEWVDEVSMPDKWRFNHYDDWPAWPANMRGRDWDIDPVTGYRKFWRILPSHSSLMHFMWDDYAHSDEPVKSKTKIMLNGMTAKDDVNALIPLAKSWERPPVLSISSLGFTGGSYDKTQRVYKISCSSAKAKKLEFALQGSPNSLIVNPCFVVKNWWPGTKARLKIDGKMVVQGPDFRQGIERSVDGTCSLVIWIRKKSSSPIRITIDAGEIG